MTSKHQSFLAKQARKKGEHKVARKLARKKKRIDRLELQKFVRQALNDYRQDQNSLV